MKDQRAHRLVLALFAAALLFSMLREASAPASCGRAKLAPTVSRSPR
jgi:hypothetical protein